MNPVESKVADDCATGRAEKIYGSLTSLHGAIENRAPGAMVMTAVSYCGRHISIGNKNLTVEGIVEAMEILNGTAQKCKSERVKFKVGARNFTSEPNLKIREAELIYGSLTTLQETLEDDNHDAEVTTNISHGKRHIVIGGNKNLTLENVEEAMKTLGGAMLGVKPKKIPNKFISKPNLNMQKTILVKTKKEELVDQLDHFKNKFEKMKIKLISFAKTSGIMVNFGNVALENIGFVGVTAEKYLASVFAKLEPKLIDLLDKFPDDLKKRRARFAIDIRKRYASVEVLTDAFRADSGTIFRNFEAVKDVFLKNFKESMTAFIEDLRYAGASDELVSAFNEVVDEYITVSM